MKYTMEAALKEKVNLQTIKEKLPDSLFEGSKDWQESDLIGRIDWLICMYQSTKEEIQRLEQQYVEHLNSAKLTREEASDVFHSVIGKPNSDTTWLILQKIMDTLIQKQLEKLCQSKQ